MKIRVNVGMRDYIFDVTEKEEAMKFALTAALKPTEQRLVYIEAIKEVDDNED